MRFRSEYLQSDLIMRNCSSLLFCKLFFFFFECERVEIEVADICKVRKHTCALACKKVREQICVNSCVICSFVCVTDVKNATLTVVILIRSQTSSLFSSASAI
jgi:hypothetical protein